MQMFDSISSYFKMSISIFAAEFTSIETEQNRKKQKKTVMELREMITIEL